MIEFAQGFIGNPSTELYQFAAFGVVVVAICIGWTCWYRHGS